MVENKGIINSIFIRGTEYKAIRFRQSKRGTRMAQGDEGQTKKGDRRVRSVQFCISRTQALSPRAPVGPPG